jgi:hypothetical protein
VAVWFFLEIWAHRMDPANILFVIAFIGLPIAFGIWAIVSRRELKRGRPPVARTRPAPPAEAEPEQPPAKPRQRRRRQLRPRQQSAQPTAPYPAVQQEPDTQQTMQAPAVPPPSQPPAPEPAPPEPPPQSPAPEPAPPAPVDYGPSGTTQEFPVIADGVMPPAEQDWTQETVSIPAQIPEEELVNAVEEAPPASQPEPAPVPAASPAPPVKGLPVRRRYYPVQYAGRSRGVVKRMTPLDQRQFVHRSRVRTRRT